MNHNQGMDRKAVFLDRDGVINKAIIRAGKPYPPAEVNEVEIISGAHDGLKRLRSLGFLLIVFTNQPDVARGSQTREKVEAIHSFLKEKLPIDAFYTCYHDDRDMCDCRKPKPGLLKKAAEDYGIDFYQSYVIGDRWRDIEAGQRVGSVSIFIDYKYAETQPKGPDFTVSSLSEAFEVIENDKKTR